MTSAGWFARRFGTGSGKQMAGLPPHPNRLRSLSAPFCGVCPSHLDEKLIPPLPAASLASPSRFLGTTVTMTFIYVIYIPRMSPFPPHGPTLGAIIKLLADGELGGKGLLCRNKGPSAHPPWTVPSMVLVQPPSPLTCLTSALMFVPFQILDCHKVSQGKPGTER